ncbi:MAG: thioredoxin [Leptolyngbyaceae cyanobacterium SM1_1_3]|nr:thioredoxin [Leptolyngbyaceae cyanobacterium SM1_1_3]NJN02861.1 thioredoxin [Leptolyngbyaceae cyanobacterium RM1_1_2]NJO09102.1 thioredoxin [Leptolyngbyaceae cyanobacterium SL_1_1]
MSREITVISDREFESEVIQTDEPVLVYFWATWCGPCRLMSPILGNLATEYGDRLKVVKMEVDPNPEAVATYKVEGVPALRLFKAGEIVAASEGAISKPQIYQLLEAHVSLPAES